MTTVPLEGSPGIELHRKSTLRLNSWSFGQVCGFAGVSKDTVNRLTPDTASMVFYETDLDEKAFSLLALASS